MGEFNRLFEGRRVEIERQNAAHQTPVSQSRGLIGIILIQKLDGVSISCINSGTKMDNYTGGERKKKVLVEFAQMYWLKNACTI